MVILLDVWYKYVVRVLSNLKKKDVNEWIIVSHDQKEMWKNILVKVNKQDIHVMNKRALGRVIPDLMEAFDAN